MSAAVMLEAARRRAGLTQSELADRAATARTAVSAYEHGRKQPSADTLERLLGSAGFELAAQPRIEFIEQPGPRGRTHHVPTQLPRLEPAKAFANVELPLALNWSQPRRLFRMIDRGDRARVYESVLVNGSPDEVLRYIDGALLIDLFEELVLPRDVRASWATVIASTLGRPG